MVEAGEDPVHYCPDFCKCSKCSVVSVKKSISDGDFFQLVHMLTDELNEYFVLMEQDDPGQSYSSFSFFWSHC